MALSIYFGNFVLSSELLSKITDLDRKTLLEGYSDIICNELSSHIWWKAISKDLGKDKELKLEIFSANIVCNHPVIQKYVLSVKNRDERRCKT